MTNFVWMLGTRNLVLVLTQQVLYPWSHFSSFCLHVCICSCAGSAHVRGRAAYACMCMNLGVISQELSILFFKVESLTAM